MLVQQTWIGIGGGATVPCVTWWQPAWAGNACKWGSHPKRVQRVTNTTLHIATKLKNHMQQSFFGLALHLQAVEGQLSSQHDWKLWIQPFYRNKLNGRQNLQKSTHFVSLLLFLHLHFPYVEFSFGNVRLDSSPTPIYMSSWVGRSHF